MSFQVILLELVKDTDWRYRLGLLFSGCYVSGLLVGEFLATETSLLGETPLCLTRFLVNSYVFQLLFLIWHCGMMVKHTDATQAKDANFCLSYRNVAKIGQLFSDFYEN